jgi:hypothetical protein
MSGAHVPDRNGAAVRYEGCNLTIRNCYFHDNEDSLLTALGGGEILIEYSEFAHNGYGDGESHYIYIYHASSFTFRYCYSHHAKVGHLVKSRAAVNYILYNRLSDELDGTASYELDLPNGGTSYVIGNVIHQGPASQNPTMIACQKEGPSPSNPGHDLYVLNNTFYNEKSATQCFIYAGPSVSTPPLIQNNISCGSGLPIAQPNASLITNFRGDPKFVAPANYDYHLQPPSQAIGAGTALISSGGFPLRPEYQYVHPACAERRTVATSMDVGAFASKPQVALDTAPGRCKKARMGI